MNIYYDKLMEFLPKAEADFEENDHIEITVDSIATSLLSGYTVFDLLEFCVKNNIKLVSKGEPWLTQEVIEGFYNLFKTANANRVRLGMQTTEKTLGRPSNKGGINLAIKLYKTGNYTLAQIHEITGVSKSTLYRHLHKT